MTNIEISIAYANQILNNTIPACTYVKNACTRFLNDIENPDYYYDDSKVDSVINFFNLLYLTEQVKPKHFILEPWQTFIICNIYGLYLRSTGLRKYKQAYLELARKNGKSQVVTALALYHLLFDVDAQVVVSANSREQAKNVNFKKVKQFANQIDKHQRRIKHYYNSLKFGSSELIVTASDASKLDGLNLSFVMIDELHSAPDNKMYNVLKSAQGSREEPLFMVITTAGFDVSSFCYQLRGYVADVLGGIAKDDSLFGLIYTLDADDDYSDTDVWIKANPNMGVSLYESFLESEVNKAVNNESERNGVKVKNFNMWLKNNSEEDWLPESVVVNAMQEIRMTDEIFSGATCYVGVDLSSVSDITAVSYMFPFEDRIYFFNQYYIPSDSINSNINKDMFRNASANGHIRITDGNVVDYTLILQDILKVNESHPIQMVSYDKWNSTSFAIDSTQAGLNMIPYAQTAGSLNKPIREFERLIKSEKIIIQKNIITKWMINNVIIKTNPMGNMSIDKSSRKDKIDGVASALNALGCWLDSPRYSFNVF